MKIFSKLFSIVLLFSLQMPVHAADLLEVYQQALCSDPIFQEAIAQRLSTKELLPINIAAILPQVNVQATPNVTRTGYAGTFFSNTISGVSNFLQPRNNTQDAYSLVLTATQTVFNFAQFSSIAAANAVSKSADATLNADLQDLMVRTAAAYLAVLQDEDTLAYTESAKVAYAEQLDQVRQQYEVGLKTVTDVYTAEASYDSAVAAVISAQTTLTNDRENLRVITGKFYPYLKKLSDNFPLITPQPADVDKWVSIAQNQNWSIKAGQYSVQSARQVIRQQLAGHLPTVALQGQIDRIYQNNINGYNTFNIRSGPGSQTDRRIGFNINVPLLAGGGVVASTNRAFYDFEVAQQKLEQTARKVVNVTRQSYLGIILGKSQISADRQAIKSNISSLDGMEAAYRVGTEILVNVLNQRQKLYEAQLQYAKDRYKFVNNILALKNAAGTLGFNDLRSINIWLIDRHEKPVRRNQVLEMLNDNEYDNVYSVHKKQKKPHKPASVKKNKTEVPFNNVPVPPVPKEPALQPQPVQLQPIQPAQPQPIVTTPQPVQPSQPQPQPVPSPQPEPTPQPQPVLPTPQPAQQPPKPAQFSN